ncbi:hypothetical protein GobsT_68770 [Gemmata obscuriglobus]|uniref:DUF1549 domain-containing protein n=1 Tax=Gemmata obscuriglobus TaxID=114 RepID=A0A2Z3HEH1_9BACT|nr:DUF1549 and DUF1553 domain-containing protein [Gemmata obscuriglobus]AWM41987.1 DUF1549 domain-containing protein [Gemmata obscuriglobus]QEG32028.1 hypothetical protein GobsT_68770 [Gemmata obscuriglobus]VTS11378.1 Uncharacterized protein OS=Pirellula staleyi (strain ATCC 27377 / DSM 6068 / ICPB 4128) GN=Psta_4131 PE=4 SV=1: PSCyt2: PSD1 [Gemmata obscuriglobus UQM 2246]
MPRLSYLLAAAVVAGAPGAARAGDVPSFTADVVPLFTKAGCNQGACHGKGAGQNGFRLSLRGFAPEQDYKWVTREFDGRRIDRTRPEESLLLRKATGQTPHEGGRLFSATSREYGLLLDWLKAGHPGPSKGDVPVSKLELAPASQVLKPGEEVQLVATATFADGSRRDVTWLTKFDSNDPAYLAVTPGGRAKALRHGASAVRAMYLTEVAVTVIGVPFDRPLDGARFAAANNFVDTHVFAKLKELRVEPSDLCTDAEFVRRVLLDACGVLPTVDEVKAFVADPDPKKREQLIDAALARPEFTDYWALQLSDLFQNRKERDHDVRGVKGVRQFHAWLRKQVAANRPWDAIARDVLTATGPSTGSPAVGYFIVTVGEHRHGESSEAPESVAQAFLGTRIGCAKCHNHPLERYTQDDFYHFAAYFSRVKLDRKEAKDGATVLRVSHPDQNQNKNPVGVSQPRTGAFMKPQPLDRTPTDVKPTDDPRAQLANWITDPKNEYFTGAMVNRVWKHYMNVGLVEPVDDLRATNPPTNPALWAALNKEFVDKKLDLRALMRVVLNSRAYQLSSATRKGNETDPRFYSHYYARRLPAEVLLDAVCDLSGVPEHFAGYPMGTRAVQVPDPGANSYFLRAFGRSDRVTACACERTGEVSLPAVLNLLGGETVTQKLNAGGWVSELLAAEKDDDKVTDALFLRALARTPTATERETVRGLLKDASRNDVYKDMLWALVNSKEFLFNR